MNLFLFLLFVSAAFLFIVYFLSTAVRVVTADRPDSYRVGATCIRFCIRSADSYRHAFFSGLSDDETLQRINGSSCRDVGCNVSTTITSTNRPITDAAQTIYRDAACHVSTNHLISFAI